MRALSCVASLGLVLGLRQDVISHSSPDLHSSEKVSSSCEDCPACGDRRSLTSGKVWVLSPQLDMITDPGRRAGQDEHREQRGARLKGTGKTWLRLKLPIAAWHTAALSGSSSTANAKCKRCWESQAKMLILQAIHESYYSALPCDALNVGAPYVSVGSQDFQMDVQITDEKHWLDYWCNKDNERKDACTGGILTEGVMDSDDESESDHDDDLVEDDEWVLEETHPDGDLIEDDERVLEETHPDGDLESDHDDDLVEDDEWVLEETHPDGDLIEDDEWVLEETHPDGDLIEDDERVLEETHPDGDLESDHDDDLVEDDEWVLEETS